MILEIETQWGED